MPKPGELRITVGALSAGCEWPALKLAVLTEGQLTAPTQKKLKLKKDSNRQKQSQKPRSPHHFLYDSERFHPSTFLYLFSLYQTNLMIYYDILFSKP